MLESGLSGSVRGVLSNEHPYREPGSKCEKLAASKCFLLFSQHQTFDFRRRYVGDCKPHGATLSLDC